MEIILGKFKFLLSKINYNSFTGAAIITALLIYGRFVNIKTPDNFFCLFPKEQAVLLEGRIISNPIKSYSQKSYKAFFKPDYAISKSGIKSECKGIVKVLLPREAVEAYFPGKLYSASKNGNAVKCENGAVLEIQGYFFSEEYIFMANSVFQRDWGKSFRDRINYIRALSRIYFRHIMYPLGEAGGLLLALLTGMKEYTDFELAESFKKAGLSHILALSGMHLSIFSGAAGFIGRKINGGRFSIIIQTASAFLFSWFAGFSPSLVRALICYTVNICIKLLNLKPFSMDKILPICFLIHVLIFPSQVFEAAFILSYAALIGIIVFQKTLCIFFIKKLYAPAASLLSVSTGAQIAAAPVIIKLTGSFIPVGIISSVLISPLISLYIYSGLFFVIISMFIPPLFPAAAVFIKILYTLIKVIVIFFSKIPMITFWR